MTKDEALRFALEALENSVDLVREDAYNAEELYGNYPARQGKVRGLKVLADDHEKAITAIKAALEAKDEPVAWRDAAIRLGEELSSVGPDGYYDMDAKKWLDWAMKQNPRGEHSLPQRTWVGLTDEEIAEVEDEYIVDYRIPAGSAWNFAKDIEAILKERNT
jgi:hypothetical protein